MPAPQKERLQEGAGETQNEKCCLLGLLGETGLEGRKIYTEILLHKAMIPSNSLDKGG